MGLQKFAYHSVLALHCLMSAVLINAESIEEGDPQALFNCYKSYALDGERMNQTMKICTEHFQMKITAAVSTLPLTPEKWALILEATHELTWCFLQFAEDNCDVDEGLNPHLFIRAIKEVHCNANMTKVPSNLAQVVAQFCNTPLSEKDAVISWQAEICKRENTVSAKAELAQCGAMMYEKLGSPERHDQILHFMQEMAKLRKIEWCAQGSTSCMTLNTIQEQCGPDIANGYYAINRCLANCCATCCNMTAAGKSSTTTSTTEMPFQDGVTSIEILSRVTQAIYENNDTPKVVNKFRNKRITLREKQQYPPENMASRFGIEKRTILVLCILAISSCV